MVLNPVADVIGLGYPYCETSSVFYYGSLQLCASSLEMVWSE